MGDVILDSETKSVYHEELNDERWYKKRIKILTLHKHKCTACKCTENLHVHHHYYIRGHKAWEYPNNALTVFCYKCHKEWHDTHELLIIDKVFRKRRSYRAPLKKGKVYKPDKKVKIQANKQPNAVLNRAKRKLIKASGYRAKESVRVFNETKDMSVKELRVYLKAQKLKLDWAL